MKIPLARMTGTLFVVSLFSRCQPTPLSPQGTCTMSPRNPFAALTLSAVASALLPLAALALPACLGAESAPDDAAETETVAEAPEALVATTSVKSPGRTAP
jgi:hypothetical protein